MNKITITEKEEQTEKPKIGQFFLWEGKLYQFCRTSHLDAAFIQISNGNRFEDPKREVTYPLPSCFKRYTGEIKIQAE